tara:strand:+ start:419 stop:655 length:237 start_codon:yes stop_codon:yes gene_type:complete
LPLKDIKVVIEDHKHTLHYITVLVVVVLVQQALTRITTHCQDHMVVMERELKSVVLDIPLELLDQRLLVVLVVVPALL